MTQKSHYWAIHPEETTILTDIRNPTFTAALTVART